MWAAFAKPEDFPDLGHAAMDDEHENIIRLMNELHDAIFRRSALTDQQRLLHELETYIRVNNRSEEEMMEKDLYPNRETHHKSHESMYKKVYEYGKTLQAGRSDASLNGLHALREILVRHIAQEDSRVASWHRIHSIGGNSLDEVGT